ncbi:MAG: hypothetical protein GTO41_22430 [Burkholderiales bacterium]|nr:hypothetical protein [Burkholderiales bacterium]
MGLIYLIENFINDTCVLSANSEDGLYVLENLYNVRPSLPYRSTGIGAVGSPEWVCIDLGTASGVEYNVTFAGLFNHNLTALGAAGDELRLKGCNDPCVSSGGCDWDNPDCEVDLTTMECAGTQPVADFRNLYHKISCAPGHRYWRLDVIDQNNTDGYLELGELVLGQWQRFPRGAVTGESSWVRLSPGRADGPTFYMGKQRTHYGQDWTTYYSESERFELKLTTQNDPCIVDALHVFLRTVQQAGGRFVIMPDETKPFCYYVSVENLRDYAERLMYGATRELREWRLELRTLTEGVRLL